MAAINTNSVDHLAFSQPFSSLARTLSQQGAEAFAFNPYPGDSRTCVNRVLYVDSQNPGPPIYVRWETSPDSDPTGAEYPGPGTFGVDTSDYCIEAIL